MRPTEFADQVARGTRAQEQLDVLPTRSERIFSVGMMGKGIVKWFFETREGAAVGPYFSKRRAELGVANFILFVTGEPRPTKQQLQQRLIAGGVF